MNVLLDCINNFSSIEIISHYLNYMDWGLFIVILNQNIYLVGDRVVINDFDISKPIVNDSLLRKDTQILGTPGFASPEQYGFLTE